MNKTMSNNLIISWVNQVRMCGLLLLVYRFFHGSVENQPLSCCLCLRPSALENQTTKTWPSPFCPTFMSCYPKSKELGFFGNQVNTKPIPYLAEAWAQGKDKSRGPLQPYHKVQEGVPNPCWWPAPCRQTVPCIYRRNQPNSTLVR